MSRQVLYTENLPEIPSEYIEQYAKRWMMMAIEGLAMGFYKPEEVRNRLKIVDNFISAFSGIHANLAIGNEYARVRNMSDDVMIKIAKETFQY